MAAKGNICNPVTVVAKKCGLLQISGWEEEERIKGKEIKISHFVSPRFAEKKTSAKD